MVELWIDESERKYRTINTEHPILNMNGVSEFGY